MTNVYFISGMGASCNVFDELTLPNSYKRQYLEWRDPFPNESLDAYAMSFSKLVNQETPFVLVGYSFGGILVQEMNKYIQPSKTILLASIKDSQQIPNYFRLGKKIHFERFVQPWLFDERMIAWIMRKFVYKTKEPIDVKKILPCLESTYMRWAIEQILQWQPVEKISNLYQIHGTKDSTFPFKKIKTAYKDDQTLFSVAKGGHLMVREQPKVISAILSDILTST